MVQSTRLFVFGGGGGGEGGLTNILDVSVGCMESDKQRPAHILLLLYTALLIGAVTYTGPKKGFYVYFFPPIQYDGREWYIKIGHSPHDPLIGDLKGNTEAEKLVRAPRLHHIGWLRPVLGQLSHSHFLAQS